MSPETLALAGTAATLGFVHTVLGPDHYLPFLVLSRARAWSGPKTAAITFICGLGHVLSSVVLGFLGLALGIAVFKLETIESWRGDIAAWLLLAFGLAYFIWGLRRAIKARPHEHAHVHENGAMHVHTHDHLGGHSHVHAASESATPWILFTVFVFGPCEPLIPLIMYPAAKGSMGSVALVAAVFGVTTIGTMMAFVLGSSYGLSKVPLRGFSRYSHALAGLTIALCGGAIKFLGL